MENILTALNFNKVCRVCLMECNSMFSIYSELFEDNSDEKIPCIYEILINISSIKVQSDDGLPTMICTKCIDKAHSSYKFQQQCNRSQALLEVYIEQIKELVKIEDASLSLAAEVLDELDQKYNLKSDMTQNDNNDSIESDPIENDPIENDMLPPELVLINEDDLIKDELNSEDCDALKNCIPLGEDTVDELIKDNLQVDNLELISPKMKSFSLGLKALENVEKTATPNAEKNY
ncbi:hypothetical protein NQ314_019707 [Rhamnusium bicolor]|uniref:ZAD domain-containing protein n=1 Tax=Rhamnusium bicolor TaxID=1586634 RepID=A0AAV8WNF2_9CUCU|nr:hypothetical protein NQ314_019707 [Rhamnusium bicolor]